MNPFEKISSANDVVDSAISLAATKKEFIGKQILNTILLFIILLVFGCLDFARLTFHFEYIVDPSYWGTVLSKTIAGVCAFNIGINLFTTLILTFCSLSSSFACSLISSFLTSAITSL